MTINSLMAGKSFPGKIKCQDPLKKDNHKLFLIECHVRHKGLYFYDVLRQRGGGSPKSGTAKFCMTKVVYIYIYLKQLYFTIVQQHPLLDA